jgi:enoyl-CoA hydratase/carnithine racemase
MEAAFMDSLSEIISRRAGSILDVTFNRPAKKNAMTSNMYSTLAELLDGAAKDDAVRVVLVHGEGDAFTAGNDLADFVSHPPAAAGSPQDRLIQALVAFDKPLVAAVHGVAIGSGTTMLPHLDFVYAAEGTKFQMPFVNLALVPEFAASASIPAQAGYLAAAELILLGQPFDARRAAEIGIVTRVVPDPLATAMETAETLATKPSEALRASKRLLKRPAREAFQAAAKAENQEFSARVRSAEAKEAFAAFFEKRQPDFTKTKEPAA